MLNLDAVQTRNVIYSQNGLGKDVLNDYGDSDMKKIVRNLTLMTSLVVLGACATATPYQEASAPEKFDGFTQTAIENDRARVSFAGNSITDRDTVENYLLFRAAELTVERGFDHFTLLERDLEQNTRLRQTGSSFGGGFYDPFFNYSFFRPGFGWAGANRFGGFRGARFGGGRFGRRGFGRRGFGFGGGFGGFGGFGGGFDVRQITKYRATAEVRFGNGEKPAENDNAFDARDVINNLGATIVYPEDAVEEALPQAPIEQTAEYTSR